MFKISGFNYIDDIILNYLEIFELDANAVKDKLSKLKLLLGKNYIKIISNDMRNLKFILMD